MHQQRTFKIHQLMPRPISRKAIQVQLLLLLATWIILFFSLSLEAQQSTGSINGTVRDSSGGAVPNAAVTLTNVNTSVKRTEATNAVGVYVINNILPGAYKLSVDHAGFGTVTRTGIVVEVNQTATFDFELPVGLATQAVTVQANAVQLEASTAELGTVITSSPVNDLPLNGRNFTDLLTLTPGASPANTTQTSFGGEASPIGVYSFPAMNGADNRANYFMLDGIDDNEYEFSTYAVSPILDDIQEFKVQSHNDQPAYGGVLGGIVNVVTKSGTNQVHGAGWELLRNNDLDADNALTHKKTPLRQNQFGGNIGGPVVIPHLYDGRGKTFFFGSYEGFRERTSSEAFSFTPTAAERQGDFSAISTPLYNPFTIQPDPSKPGDFTDAAFAGNNISGSLSPAMVRYANLLWPLPNTNSPSGNLLDGTPGSVDQNEWNIRVDENLNNSNSLWFRYSTVSQPSLTSGGFPGYRSQLNVNATNYGLNYLHTFGPSTTLDVQFGHDFISNQNNSYFTAGSAASINSAVGFTGNYGCGGTELGLPVNCVVVGAIPSGYINGSGALTHHNPLTDLYQYSADLTKVVGHHTFQTGFIFQRNDFYLVGFQAQESFAAPQTSNPEIPGTGNALASFFIGVPDTAFSSGYITPIYGLKSIGGYAQDQWKVLPKLTLSGGIRYDVTLWPMFGTPGHDSDAVGTIDFKNGDYIIQDNPGSCAQLGVPPCIPGGLSSLSHVVVSPNGHLWHNAYDNWQPRFGFAYKPTDSNVIRGSVGLFFDEWAGVIQHAQATANSWPSVGTNQLVSENPTNAPPTYDATNPISGVTTFPAANPYAQSRNYRDPYGENPLALQWNFGIQHLIGTRSSLEVDYVGSHSERLVVGGDYNVDPTPGPGSTVARQPFPYLSPSHYDRYVGTGDYNALQVKFERKPVHGLGYIVSYTWSKAIDEGCDGIQDVEGCSVEDPYDLRNDRSVAGFDLPQVLSLAGSYELPFGRGKYFDISDRVLNGVVGGWQINGIFSATSGLDYNLTIAGDIANTGNIGYERVDKVGNATLSDPTTSQWFNKAAFAAPAQYTFGNLARNALRADPYNDLDVSAFKNFPIKEAAKLQFRVEAFNALNHPTWGTPGTSFGTAAFGVVSATRSTERVIQLSLKVYY